MNIKSSGIYEIVNMTNGHKYIGSTVNFRDRWKSHRCCLRKGQYKNSHFQYAWNKYGEQMFEFNILAHCPKESIYTHEQIFINEENPEYNSAPNATSPNIGRVRGEAECKAISNRMLGNKYSLGIKHTEETKQKMSKSRMGNKNCLGHKLTEEHKANISKTLREIGHGIGGIFSAATRWKISESQKKRLALRKLLK